MWLCPKDENFSRHAEQFFSLWVGLFQPPGPVSEWRQYYEELNYNELQSYNMTAEACYVNKQLSKVQSLFVRNSVST